MKSSNDQVMDFLCPVVTSGQFHSKNLEFWSSAVANPADGVSEIFNDENL